jgi:hypothetical protein
VQNKVILYEKEVYRSRKAARKPSPNYTAHKHVRSPILGRDSMIRHNRWLNTDADLGNFKPFILQPSCQTIGQNDPVCWIPALRATSRYRLRASSTMASSSRVSTLRSCMTI